MKVTKLESQVLQVFYNEAVDCCGECTEDQNMSYCNANDVAQVLHLTEQQVGGVFTSLLNKGLILDTKDSARRSSGASYFKNHTNDFVLGNIFEDNEIAPEIAKLLNLEEVA
tara:strand:+ start:820 stop:1155 length:336 start_codon:yes stop_codon:yes gene_type:complete